MKPTTIYLTLVAVLLAVMSRPGSGQSPACSYDSQCASNCCYKFVCQDDPGFCPCALGQGAEEACKPGQTCVAQEVQCFTTPCYPVRNCMPATAAAADAADDS